METILESITFDYSEADKKLFKNDQNKYWKEIENSYQKLRENCSDELKISEKGTHKQWTTQRVRLHATTSVMRLLYLTESFRDSSIKFNAPAAAIHIKAMTEIPLHLGYLVWILSEHNEFKDIREHLSKLAWGDKDKDTQLTSINKIKHKELYTRGDQMIKKMFKEDESTINLLERIYKEANATGHHNYEGRNMLVGVQNDDTWRIKGRKEWFVFLSSNIFQFFLHCETILHLSLTFLGAIDFYLDQMPDYYKDR
jgi:hypothetical protein